MRRCRERERTSSQTVSDRFYIRADGNGKIGMGHVQRCLSLAKALKKQGADPVFLTADEEPAEWLETAGISHISLGTDYREMERELPRLTEILQKDPGPVLVDSYQITKAYMKSLCGLTGTLLLSDDNEQVFACHDLINYNIYAEDLGYEETYGSSEYHTRLYLGPKYAPLREEFTAFSEEGADQKAGEEGKKKVLLTTGGSDGCHLGLLFAQRIAEGRMPESFEYHVLCGPFCGDVDRIRETAEGHENLVVDGPVTKMAAYLKNFDLVLSAAGSTLYELCALGIPAMTFTTAENQNKNAKAFSEKSEMIFLGDGKADPEALMDKAEAELSRLCSEAPSEWNRIGASMKSVTDGHGAEYLAEAILSADRMAGSADENTEQKSGSGVTRRILWGISLMLLGVLLFCGTWNARHKQKTAEDFRPLSEAEEKMLDEDPELLILGDSLFARTRDHDTIPGRIAEKTGLRIFNAAIGGSTAASANEELDFARHMDAFGLWNLQQALVDGDYGVIRAENEADLTRQDYFSIVAERLSKVDLHRVKYLLIAYGSNDYTVGHDPYNKEDPEDIYSLGCVLKMTVENIREGYPGITVILVTPKYCVINGEDCMTRDFGGGTLTAYVDAIKTVGAEEHIPVIDSFYESGINAENIMDYTGGEGLHFNREGVIFYGDYLGDEILKIMNR